MKENIPIDFNPSITHPSYLTRNRLLKGLKKYSTKLNGRLLDFGCGSKPYQSLFEVDEYVGVDFENPGHPHLNEKIDFFYDGKLLPFSDAQFDSILSSEVFEHIFNLEQMLKELNRVLKPGGQMLITCPFAICEHEVPNDFARYSSFAIQHLLKQNGFEIVAFEKLGNSVETVSQLFLMYIHQHITPFVRKVPVVRSLFRFCVYTSINILTVISSKILPDKRDLYLNNIVLARKIKPV
jgi:SAM-dependent methyltransferase